MKGTLGTSSLSPRREGAPSGRSSSIGALEVLNPKSCVAIAAALHFGVEPWPFDTYVYIYINIYEHVFITLVRYCDATLFLQPRFFFLHVSPPLFFCEGIRGHQYEPSVSTSIGFGNLFTSCLRSFGCRNGFIMMVIRFL